METTLLTADDKARIRQLLTSPTWGVVIQKVILPELVQINGRLDMALLPQAETEHLRGRKTQIQRMLTLLYGASGVRNPFDQHRDAFLMSLPPMPVVDDPPAGGPTSDAPVQEKPRRVRPGHTAQPVL